MDPLNDEEIRKVLVVSAHPDDSDFGASGTIASWIAKGIDVSYCICTNGDQGGEESGIPVEEMPAVRQREQRAAGKAIGVDNIIFLNYIYSRIIRQFLLIISLLKKYSAFTPD